MTGPEQVRRLDVISQGRDPKRNFRLPPSRRWRVALAVAAVLGVAAVLAATGVSLRHGTRSPDAAAASATPVPPASVPTATMVALPFGGGNSMVEIPAPAGNQSFVVCSPSTEARSTRIIIVHGVAFCLVRNAASARLGTSASDRAAVHHDIVFGGSVMPMPAMPGR